MIYIVGPDEMYEGAKVQGVFLNLTEAENFAREHVKERREYTYIWCIKPGEKTHDSFGLLGNIKPIRTIGG